MYFLTESEVIICMEYVWKSSLGIDRYNVYFKELHNEQDTIDRQHTGSMGSCSVNYY